MREPRPDWSPLGVNFKILDEHPYLFYISSPPRGSLSWRQSRGRLGIKISTKGVIDRREEGGRRVLI